MDNLIRPILGMFDCEILGQYQQHNQADGGA